MNQTINDTTKSQVNSFQYGPPLEIRVENYMEKPVELILVRLGRQIFKFPDPGGHDFTVSISHPQIGTPLSIEGFNRDSQNPNKAAKVFERIYDSNTYHLGSVSLYLKA
jgi:hypothetical protein